MIRIKKAFSLKRKGFQAENEGFEPPVPCGTTVFKTAAFDHSANSPKWTAKLIVIFNNTTHLCKKSFF
jgi:hypothetical protein